MESPKITNSLESHTKNIQVNEMAGKKIQKIDFKLPTKSKKIPLSS